MILAVAVLQLRIIAQLPGLGYTCLALGVSCYILSHCDSLLKPLCPLLAENLVRIDRLLDSFAEVERAFLRNASNITTDLNYCCERSTAEVEENERSGVRVDKEEGCFEGASGGGYTCRDSDSDGDCHGDDGDGEVSPDTSSLHANGLRRRR